MAVVAATGQPTSQKSGRPHHVEVPASKPMLHDVEVAAETPMIAAKPSNAAIQSIWLNVGNDAP